MQDVHAEDLRGYSLYKHQEAAIAKIGPCLREHDMGALFMEMGTGKTRTALALYHNWYTSGSKWDNRVLVVVAPKSILPSWEAEAAEVFKSIPYYAIRWEATKSHSKTWAKYFEDWKHWKVMPILFVNIEALQVPNEDLITCLKACYDGGREMFLVVDESSTIKTHNAKRTKNVIALGKKASRRLIMTGTEITNSPLDLYSQFEFLKPGFWGLRNFFLFKAYYSILEKRYTSRGSFDEVVGYRRLEEMQERIAPYIFRVLKKDCLDLPPKIYAPIYVELSPKERKAYDDLKRDLFLLLKSGEVLTVVNKMALFAKFRQVVGGSVIHGEAVEPIDGTPAKLRALLDDIEDTHEQAIVWAAFTHEIDMLVEALAPHGGVVRFDGHTPQAVREEGMRAFQAGEKRFFVANPAACSMGINLQNAHLQYFYSRTLSPSENSQAEDRIHRIGQDSPCVYKSLIAKDSVDVRIEAILLQKKDIRESFQLGTIQDMVEIV